MFSVAMKELIITASILWKLDANVLLAVVEVESHGKIYTRVNGTNEPLIQFEGHYFYRRLSGTKLETAKREGLAAPVAGTIRNPTTQAARWRLLERASRIDRKAAYESTSWGIGQVMGAHWAWLGYSSVDALVKDARSGIHGQLHLMMRYIEKAGLLDALRQRNWAEFARGYNGSSYARHGYHLKLSLAYRRYLKTPEIGADIKPAENGLRLGDHGADVRALQSKLRELGFSLTIDDIFGPTTLNAVIAFQKINGLVANGIAGPQTLSTLRGVARGNAFEGIISSAIRVFRRIAVRPE